MNQSTTLLFALPGVHVDRVSTDSAAVRFVEVFTDDERTAARPGCGVVSTSVKGHTATRPRDIPYGGFPIRLQWSKTRWRCRENYCQRGSFTESIDELPPQSS